MNYLHLGSKEVDRDLQNTPNSKREAIKNLHILS